MKKSYSESSIKGVSPFIGESRKNSQRSLGSSRRISVVPQVAPPVIEEPNPLLDDVRLRLSKLRKQQRIDEIEAQHILEQKRMEHDMFEAEVQDIISKKIKEMAQLEEDSQNNSLQSSPLRYGKSRGHGHIRHSGQSTPILAHDCTPPKKSPPFPHNSNPRSRPNSGTIPSSSVLSPISPAATPVAASRHENSRSPLPPLKIDSDDTNSEIDNNSLSSLNSLSYNSNLTSTGRPMLIIVKKIDINKQKILETVQEKLPSPKTENTEPLTPTAAFPASLIFRPDYYIEESIISSPIENNDKIGSTKQGQGCEVIGVSSGGSEGGSSGRVAMRTGAMVLSKHSSYSLTPLSSSSKSDNNDDNYTTTLSTNSNTNTTSNINNNTTSNRNNYMNNENGSSSKIQIGSKKHTNNSSNNSNSCSLKKAVSDITTLLRSNEDITQDNEKVKHQLEEEEVVVENEVVSSAKQQHIHQQHGIGEALIGLSVNQLRGSFIRQSQLQHQLQQHLQHNQNETFEEDLQLQLQQPGNPSSEKITSYTYNNTRTSIRRRGTNTRSSQQFRLNTPAELITQNNLAELQGTAILEARFGGWSSPAASSQSTKHSGASTFY